LQYIVDFVLHYLVLGYNLELKTGFEYIYASATRRGGMDQQSYLIALVWSHFSFSKSPGRRSILLEVGHCIANHLGIDI
jgi:hypothetical protein